MRQNNITKWKYDSSLNCLLFFAQRLDELLFHHTTDTYRYPSLSLRGLAAEYCSVYSDVRTGTVNKKNLEHIIEELSGRLVCTLSDSLQNSKEIKSLIKAHTQRVTWHLHRIYRARNYIIHDANSNNRLNEGLVINLHSYVDTLFSEVITHISISPYNDSIYDAITNHKLSVLIMDEKLENRKNEEITVDNALQYLYYDFER